MKKRYFIKKMVFGLGSALFMGVLFFAAQPTLAGVIQPAEVTLDDRISSVSFTPASTVAGATTDYTVAFTLTEDLLPGGFINFNFEGSGNCQGDWSQCQPRFQNATLVSGFPGGTFDRYDQSFGLRKDLFTAGNYSVVLSGVVNPGQLMSHYRVYASSQAYGEEPPPEGQRSPSTPSDPYFFAPIAVKGTITDSSGDPAAQLGVGFHTSDFSFNTNGNTDQLGFYSVPAADFPNGTVVMEIWLNPDYNNDVAPDPVELQYTGTTVTKDAQLKIARKKIVGTLRYNNGAPVMTGAEINANRQGGGGGKNAQVQEDGTYEMFLSGGSWEVRPNCGWDQELNQQRVCDWTYNDQGELIQFANNDTAQTITKNITVTRTDAIIKGRVKLPNGSWLSGGGGVNLQQGQGKGMGTGVNSDGRFLANVNAGTYQMSVNPNNQDPNMARYYLPTMTVTVASGQTLDLGTLTMEQKTSKITGKVTLVDTADPVAGLSLNCWMRNGSGGGQTTTIANGTYSIWLAPGQYECRPDDRNTNYIMPQNGPSELYDLTANKTISGVDFEVQEADARINVVLQDTDGNGISNVYGWTYARIKNSNNGSNFGSGIDRGTATIALLGGETYVVGAQVPTDNENVLLLREEVEIVLAEGETANVALVMEKPDALIRGYLKDQKGKAIKGTDAEVYAMVGGDNKGGGGPWLGTRVNPADGSYTLNVKGGQKYIMGYNFPDMGKGSNSEFLNSSPNMEPFTVPVNGKVTKILTAFRATAHIKVSLLDPDGNPVKFGWAWCSNRKEMENKVEVESTVVDTGGEIRNGAGQVNVIAGTFECGAGFGKEMVNNWMPPDMQKVTLVDGDTENITMQFGQADSTIRGTAAYENGDNVPWGFCNAFTFNGKFSGAEIMDGKFAIPVNSGDTWQVECGSDNNRKMSRSDAQAVNVSTPGEKDAGKLTLLEKNWTIPEGFSTQFDAGTQLSLSLLDGTMLSAPPNTFGDEGDTITLTASPNINLYYDQNNKLLNFAWNFEVSLDGVLIESFNSDVTITIPYSQEVVDEQGLDENNLIAKYYDPTQGAWVLPPDVTQNTENNTISFTTSHFTNFALVAGANVLGGLGTTKNDILVTPLSNGGPQVVIADANGNIITNFFAYSSSLRIGIQAITADVDGDGEIEIITAPGAGAGPQIRIFNKAGQLENQFWAYDSGLRMGVNLSVVDDDGDGVYDIVTAPMAGGGPHVKIFNAQGEMKRQFFAYAETFRGGVELAVGDVNGDGAQELVVAPSSAAGPQIRVLKTDGTVLSSFFAYASTVRGGYNLTLGDVTGDGAYDIVVSPKAGLGPQVASFDWKGNLLGRFFAYAETFRGGIFASGGDVDGDGNLELVVTPESGAGPQVRVFEVNGTVLSQFWAYSSTLRGNFTSFVADLNGDGTTEIVTAPGAGMGPQVRTFDQNGHALSQFFSHHPGFRGGITISPAI